MKFWQKKKYIPKNTCYCYEFKGYIKNGVLPIKTCKFFKFLGKQHFSGEYNNVKYSENINVYVCKITHITSIQDVLLNEKIKNCGIGHEYINESLMNLQDKMMKKTYKKFRNHNILKAIKLT